MIVGNPIIMILKAILNWFRLRRDYIANAVDKIPPEIKDALVAWYSPVKQKLSNYDVIESYIIDFTTFNNRDDAIINNNKFVFTGNVVVGINYERIQVEKYNSYKILIKGLTGGIYYYYRNVDGVENYIIFNKDGVYDIPVSYKQGTEGIIMGYRCNSTTECTVTQLPTSILKDFSGNRHDAYLYGFKGRLNSGMGVYQTDFTTWSKTNFDVHPEYIIATNGNNNLTLYGVKINSINVEIKGYNDKVKFLRLGYNNNDGVYKELNIFNDGIYTIPGYSLGQEGRLCSISISLKEDTKITITQIPDYPDQLCYDGKMYAIAYDMPILTDYTIIANRTWFVDKQERVFMSKVAGQNGAFIFEYKTPTNNKTYSYYQQNDIVIDSNNKVVYQTKNSYNGTPIQAGNKQDTDVLYIGNIRVPDSKSFIGCHGDILLFNRTLTDDELDLVKEHFFGIVRIKDALLTVDGKPIITTDNKYIKVNKK
jgi:hypothetical protein